MEKSQMLLKLEALKKELASKSKKLEKSKHGAKVKAYVRKKIKEHNELDCLDEIACKKKGLEIVGGKQMCSVDRKTIDTNLASGDVSGSAESCPQNVPSLSSLKDSELSKQRLPFPNKDMKQNMCKKRKNSGKILSEHRKQVTMSGKSMTKTLLKSKLQQSFSFPDSTEKHFEKITDGNEENGKQCQIIDSDSQIVIEPKASKRLSLVNAANVRNPSDFDSHDNVSSIKSSDSDEKLIFATQDESHGSNSSKKSTSGPISKSMSSVDINKVIGQDAIDIINDSGSFKCQKGNAVRLEVSPDIVNINNSDSDPIANHNKSPNTNTTIPDFKRSIQGNKQYEDSLCFITPSFQSEKQHSELAAGKLNKRMSNNNNQVARHDGLMSNADFLNVLGIPQNDYDVDRCQSDSRNNSPNINIIDDNENVTTYNDNKDTAADAIISNSRGQKSTRKSLTLKSGPCGSGNNMNVESLPHTPLLQLQANYPESNSAATAGSASSLTEDYTELDVIPYSQFELTEDFLSETPCSQTDSNSNTKLGSRKRKGRPSGPLIKRKSPRLSSNLFPWKSPQCLSSDSQNSADSLSSYKRGKQSLSVQRKAIAVMSVFQLLVDEAKKKSDLDFQLPDDFLGCLESKPFADIGQNVEFDGMQKNNAMNHKDMAIIIEDSEIVELSGEMRENDGKECEDAKQDECHTVCPEVDVIADTEVVDLDEELDDKHLEGDTNYFDMKSLSSPSADSVLKQKTKESESMPQESLVEIGAFNRSHKVKAFGLNKEQRKNDNGGTDCHNENSGKITTNKKEDELNHKKNEIALSVFGGDADHELIRSLMREVDDTSVIQSSYHSTPVRRTGSGKRNKMALLHCRRSLDKPLATRGKLPARLALDNNSKSKTETWADNDTEGLTNPIEFDGSGSLKRSSEMLSLSGSEHDTYEKVFSPVRNCGNCESSPIFMNSLMSSSTPKVGRHKSTVLPVQGAPSPIAGDEFLSPLQTKSKTMDLQKSLPASPECGMMKKSQSRLLYSLTSTPTIKQIQTFPFSPLEKRDPPCDGNTSGFHEGNSSIHIHDCNATLKAPDDESNQVIIAGCCDDDDSVLQRLFDSDTNSISDVNSTSKTETRLTVGGDNNISFNLLVVSPKEHQVSSLCKSLDNIYPDDKQISTKANRLEISGGKSPFSKYLEESVVLQETTINDDNSSKSFSTILRSPDHISPWQRIPKTATTPLQIFETSCTASPRLLSPIYTHSRVSRSRAGKSSSGSVRNRSKKTLKFEGCFQSCSEDAVVQLLHGQLLVHEATDDDNDNNNGNGNESRGRWKRYLVSIQASALTIWIQNDDNQNDWSPELDWRLSATIHILHACILPVHDKIAVAASGWDKTEPIVTVFVYDFVGDHTLRFNIADGLQSDLKISQIHLCPSPSPPSTTPPPTASSAPAPPASQQLLLGVSSDSQHTLHHVTFHSDIIQGVSACEAFDSLLRGKLNTLVLCRGQDKACASLTWDQRITIWNTEYRIALKTVAIPSHLPCLTALLDVRAVKGLLFVTASCRVEEMGDCGGILVWNPMTGFVDKTRFWNIPNAGWRSTEKTNKDKNQIYSVSSSGSVTWWDGRSGDMVGYRQSNIATCVSGIEDRHLVVGEMHGCVHLYSVF